LIGAARPPAPGAGADPDLLEDAARDDGRPEAMSAQDIGARPDLPLLLLRHDRDEVLSIASV